MSFSSDPRIALWEREWARIEAHEPPPNADDPPRRHHYVPEMYLRRFASSSKAKRTPRVRRVDARRGPGSAITIGVRDAAVETDFYRVEVDDARHVHEAEHIVGVFEMAAGYALASLDRKPNDLLDAIDRENLSLYLALQFVRGPDTGDFLNRIYTETSRMAVRVSASQPDYVRNFLREQGKDSSDDAVAQASARFTKAAKRLVVTPHKNDVVVSILRGPVEFLPYFFKRKWIIGRSKVPFLTTDRPVVLVEHRDPRDARRGVGLATADMIIFVLDRYRVLMMQHPLPEHQEGIIDIDPRHARVLNAAVANQARRWIFHHPDDSPLADIPFNPKGPGAKPGAMTG